jgi:hypothetical protein
MVKAYDVASLNGVGSILILTNEMSLYDLIMWQVNPLKKGKLKVTYSSDGDGKTIVYHNS